MKRPPGWLETRKHQLRTLGSCVIFCSTGYDLFLPRRYCTPGVVVPKAIDDEVLMARRHDLVGCDSLHPHPFPHVFPLHVFSFIFVANEAWPINDARIFFTLTAAFLFWGVGASCHENLSVERLQCITLITLSLSL